MKTWWLHTAACIANGVTATSLLLLLLFDLFTHNSNFNGESVIVILIFLIGYSVYIISDFWGLKLYSFYKNLDSVSFTNAGKTHVILFFLILIQAFAGYASFYITLNTIKDLSEHTFNGTGKYLVGRFLILALFITGVIVFVGCILLLVAIKKNMKSIAKEVDIIGN